MGLCLLSLKFYGRYWQGTFSHIQSHFRASSLSVSPSLLPGPFLPAWISIPLSLPIYTVIHDRAKDERDEEVTCCLHLALRHQQSLLWLHSSSVWPFPACKACAWLGEAGMLKQVCCCVCLCLYMHSRSPLSSDLWFGFNCCVNLSSTLIGCSPLMLPRHIASVGQRWSACCRQTAASNHPNNNHILITQPHQTCLMEAHPDSFSSVHYIYNKTAPVSGAEVGRFKDITHTL